MRHVSWESLPRQQLLPGVTAQRFDTTTMTIIRYQFAPGAQYPIHAHPEEQVVMVCRGHIHFTVAGETLLLGPGDVCPVKPHVPHGAAATAEAGEFLNVLSPRRPEA